MGNLVISHGENCAGATIQQFTSHFLQNRNLFFFYKKSIEINRIFDFRYAVFGKKNHLNGPGEKKINKIPDNRINLLEIFSNRRCPSALKIVIEMRQINQ